MNHLAGIIRELPQEPMNSFIKTSIAIWQMLRNKLVAILILLALLYAYKSLPADQPVPFAELLYAVILVFSVMTLAPIMRLAVFPEVARYAEGEQLTFDLAGCAFKPALIHYWIATLICYGTTLLCVSSLLSH